MPGMQHSAASQSIKRVRTLFALMVFVISVFVVRAFYLQVIQYGHYQKAAAADQLVQEQIPATRGLIEAESGNSIVPIVLNQTLYTVYVDPTLVKNVPKVAQTLSDELGGSVSSFESQLRTSGTRYVVLGEMVPASTESAILSHKYPGVGATANTYRTYPDGSLASQVLGFVNQSGQGEYGVEQALNKQLAGTPGELKAVTDINGVPLAADSQNELKQPVAGQNVVLSIDVGMQEQMEQILASEYKATNSQGLSAVIMDPNNGQIKAMANYPTYDPANYQDVTDPSLFQNAAVSNAIEPGSIMKTLTTSAALNVGAIQPDSSFYDPAHWVVDGFNITDIEQDGGAREQNIASILALSLNTGAVWMLMQMSQQGGTTISQKGINTWYNYMTNHFRLGEETGVEQGYESGGYVPTPDPTDPSIDLTYAETAFGQGVTVTALQMAAAISSVLNGGTYYKPTLVSEYINPTTGATTQNKPVIEEKDVVSPKVGQELIPLMENVVTTYLHEGFGFMSFSPDYMVGGKTGTAQVAQPGGGYYSSIFNGTYIGFVGGDTPQYVIVVFNTKPNVPGYAGSLGGQPVFADLAHMLINNFGVTPKTQ